MNPRIMASSPEISMTPIRMMSRRVIGMTEFACSASSRAGGRIGDCNHTQRRHLLLGPRDPRNDESKYLRFQQYPATPQPQARPQVGGSRAV